MEIKRLVPADAEAYRALMLRAFREEPDAFTSSLAEREKQPLSWWQETLSTEDNTSTVVLGAEFDTALVGVGGIKFSEREKTNHKAGVFGMYVAEEARGRKLATHLLQGLIDIARQNSSTEVLQLTVTDGNKAATQLYLQNDFIQFGAEPFAVRTADGYVSKLHLWRRV
ncbi:MAG: GNAT family N-acetyltransferase [Gammaproteobacteria bacterium]|nr:GNAT family N-acetyltransferase [Gammaproteobacteria bacterium]